MQLHHLGAEQRLGLGLNSLVEPSAQGLRQRASDCGGGIDLNLSVATKRFQQDRRGRSAQSLLDRGERLVVELDRGQRLSALRFGRGDLGVTPG